MTAILGSDVIPFLKTVGLTGAKDISQSGTQFSDIFQVFGRGAGTGSSDISNSFGQISNFIKNLFTSKSSLPPSDISGGQVGFPSQIVGKVQSLPRTVNPNLVIGTAGALGTTGFLALTATNPGVQQTAQSFSSGFNSLAQGAGSITNTLSQNPLILIALIGLGVIVILKK